MEARARIRNLDILRAVAVLVVLCRHLMIAGPPVWVDFASFLQRGGWVGVDLFFVLSGFLVGGLLIRELRKNDRLSLWRFYARRGFKIYPQFWIFVAFMVVWQRHLGEAMPMHKILVELFFVQNYTRGVWGPTWSLAVEEHFYLLLPFVLLLVRRIVGPAGDFCRGLAWCVGGVVSLCLGLRAYNASVRPFLVMTHLTPTHLRLDALFVGVLVAAIHEFHPVEFQAFVQRRRTWLWACGIFAFAPAFILDLGASWYLQVPGLAIHELGAAALICWSLSCRPSNGFFAKALARIGRGSYATYLWHGWISWHALYLGLRGNPNAWWLHPLLFVILSLVLGDLLTKIIETPFLALRDRLVPASRGEASPPPAVEPALADAVALAGAIEPQAALAAEVT